MRVFIFLRTFLWGGSPEPPGAQAPWKAAFGRAALESRPTFLYLSAFAMNYLAVGINHLNY
jgi:hypothetical protein